MYQEVEYTAELTDAYVDEDVVALETAKEAYDAAVLAAEEAEVDVTDLLVDEETATVADYETATEAINAAVEAAEDEAAAEALAEAKTDAVADLVEYVNAEDYTENADELTAALAAGEEAVDAAETTEEVEVAVAAAKEAIDAIETDEEIAVREAEEALQAATAAVENAEESLLEADLAEAVELVEALPEDSAEYYLLGLRTSGVQAKIDNIIVKIEDNLDTNDVLLYNALNVKPLTDVKAENIGAYKTGINGIEEDLTLAEIQEVIDNANTAAEDKVTGELVGEAVEAVWAVETAQFEDLSEVDEGFDELVTTAQDAIDAIEPADYKENEEDEKTVVEVLQERLDEAVRLQADYVEKVLPVVNAEGDIALYNALTANFDRVDENLVNEYDEAREQATLETVEDVQYLVDTVNATAAVGALFDEEALAEDVAQPDIDAAKAKVELLEDPRLEEEQEDETKQELLADIERAQGLLDARNEAAQDLADATEAVNALFEDVEADDKALAEGVDQDAIDAAEELVTALDDSEEKTALSYLVEEAQGLQDEADLEAATKAVYELFVLDEDGNPVGGEDGKTLALETDQDAIDAAEELVTALDDSEEKTALSGLVEEAQGLQDAINNRVVYDYTMDHTSEKVIGYGVNFNVTFGEAKIEEFVVELYKGDTPLGTVTGTEKLMELLNGKDEGDPTTAPFDVLGEFDYVNDGYWENTNGWIGEAFDLPTKVKATAVFEDGRTVNIDEDVTVTHLDSTKEKLTVKLVNIAETAEDINDTLLRKPVADYLNVPNADKLFVAEEVLEARNNVAETKKFDNYGALTGALSSALETRTDALAGVNNLTAQKSIAEVITALEGVSSEFEAKTNAEKSQIAEAFFLDLEFADGDDGTVKPAFRTLAEVKALLNNQKQN